MRTLLLAREATGWARLGDGAATRRALIEAENAFNPRPKRDDPYWICFLDEAELVGLKAASLSYLGLHDRSEPPYEKDEDDVAEFRDRFDRQVVQPGFTLVTATTDGVLVGFAYGLTFEAGKWWRGAIDEPPEIRDATKFAVIELVLRASYRGKGLGRRLMDELLKDRPETYAMLLSNPKAPARRVYDRWGWRQVGAVQSYPHWLPSDALVLPLRQSGA